MYPNTTTKRRFQGALLGIVFILCFGLAMMLPGCATSGGGDGGGGDVQIEIAIGIASDAAALVLANNPEAVPVVRAVEAGIDAVLARGELTPAQVVAFVDSLDLRGRLSPEERMLMGRAVLRVHGILQAYYGADILSTADPRVAATLMRIRDGLRQTLELYEVLAPGLSRSPAAMEAAGVSG